MNAGKFAITVVTAMMLLTTGVSAMTMPGYGMGSTEDDAIIMTESETSGFNTYYNSAYGYALDIPAAASEAEATSKGEGCYFEDPDTHAGICYKEYNAAYCRPAVSYGFECQRLACFAG